MAKKILGLNIKLITENSDEGLKIKKISQKDIAIIGIGIQMPMADELKDFWENLRNGLDCVRDFPANRRLEIEKFLRYKKINLDKQSYQQEAYLDEIDKFDYGFFRLNPKEAELMDPNQRIFLETAWKAIEDSGYGGGKLSGSNTGVFLGFSQLSNVYHMLISEVQPEMSGIALPGNLPSIIASRISYYMDLRGSCMTIDTACSSSLVAVHTACQSIRNGECDMALAGSIKIDLLPIREDNNIGIESSDSRAKSFDNSSDGTGLGEGAVAILLKPLHKALEDNDNIYAVIKGSAVNHDGTSIGITAPNVLAQEEVIVRAWKNAEVNPESITYIEAHGTGTKLGDPIEIDGITRAFRRYTNRKQFCGIGSIKTNLGHMDQAAGIAGLLKTILALKNNEIPSMLHFSEPNRKINFEESPVFIVDEPVKWERQEEPRRCGVSSFGLSGTNCHLILEEAPLNLKHENKANLINILTLSAKSKKALKTLMSKYRKFAIAAASLDLEDMCYTTNTGRGHYEYRLALVLSSVEDLRTKLDISCEAELEEIIASGIYYNEHKIIGNNYSTREDREFTQKQIEEFTSEAASCLGNIKHTTCINNELAAELCQLYVNGANIEWEKLYDTHKVRKISLPTYPFEKKRCFIEIPDAQAGMFYKTGWKEENLEIARTGKAKETCMVLKTGGVVCQDKIIESLKRYEDLEIIEVQLDTKYLENSPNSYMVANEAKDFSKLASVIKNRNIKKVIHLAALSSYDEIKDIKGLEESQEVGVLCLYRLARAIAEETNDSIDIVLVGDYVNYVTQREEKLKPETATLFGLGKAIVIDTARIRCRCIDIDDNTQYEKVAEEISLGIKTYMVAYRDNTRYIEQVEEVDFNKTEQTTFETSDEGVYVITGGIGSIGVHIAKYLSSKNKVKLALINRSPIPDRENWSRVLSEAVEPRACRAINVIQELEESGLEVLYLQGDISKPQEASLVLERIKNEFGRINGVIHCAGVGVGKEGTMITEQAEEDLLEILRPKVIGTWLLNKLLEKEPPDFVVMFSSAITLMGGFGLGGYTAANSYLDAYCAYGSMKGQKVLAINWPEWSNDNFKDNKQVFFAINPTQGVEAFEKVMSMNFNRVIVGYLNGESDAFLFKELLAFRLSDEIEAKLKENRDSGAIPGDILNNIDKVKVALKGSTQYSETEKLVGQIWGATLGYNEVNIHDDFYQMGGDSIFAMKVVNSINKRMSMNAEIPDILKNPSIYEFSRFLEQQYNAERDSVSSREIPLAQAKAFYEVSSAQKRLYIVNQLEGKSIGYNMPLVFIADGELDTNKIESIFEELVKRHESLRTSFEVVENQIVQRIHAVVDFKVNFVQDTVNDLNTVVDAFIKPFELNKAPLLRVGVVRQEKSRYCLLFDMHHIISDGVSMAILMSEFIKLYRGNELPELKLQYKDFSEWQSGFIGSEEIKKQEDYWLQKLSGKLPELKMPTDFPRPAEQSFDGNSIANLINKGLCSRLNHLAAAKGTTLYTVMLAAFKILLSKYTGQQDIIVASPLAGRSHEDLQHVLGMFVNTVVMRTKPEEDKTFEIFLEEVKRSVMGAFGNQEYPFEDLVQKLGITRDLSRNPIYDVVFTLQNINYEEFDIEGLKLTPYLFENRIAKVDLALTAIEENGEMKLDLEYCTKLFEEPTMERLLKHYVNILEQITIAPEVEIRAIQMVATDELQHMKNKLKESKKTINVDFDF